MEKPILAIDFSGALLTLNPFDTAHEDWFSLFASLLHDKSIKEYARTPNYFEKVDKVMIRYLGDVEKDVRTYFAREIFSMIAIAKVEEKDIHNEFRAYLEKIKEKYSLALITSSPASSVNPILKKVGCSSLFDLVYKSPSTEHPNKEKLFKEFIRKEGKPAFYIGYGDSDLKTIGNMGIKTISVNWIKEGENKGDYNIAKVGELEKIL